MQEQDPLGLLERAPVLRELLHLPGVADAIAAGKAHKLYGRLLEARRKGVGQRFMIDEALRDSRLFLQPLKKHTKILNLRGRSEEAPDGTYVATEYLTVLAFIPLLPLGRYLVRDLPDRGVEVFGRLPASPGMRRHRKLVGAAAGLAALVAAFLVFDASQTNDLHLLNSLDIPVDVSVAGEVVRVEPQQRQVVKVPTEMQALAAHTPDGRLLERLEVEIPSFTQFVGFNVLGATPLFAGAIVYGSPTQYGEEPPSVFYGGQSFVARKASYVFEEPPETIRLRRGSKRQTRWLVDLPMLDWRVTVAWFVEMEEKPEAALALLGAVLRAQPDDETAADARKLGRVLDLSDGEVDRLLEEARIGSL